MIETAKWGQSVLGLFLLFIILKNYLYRLKHAFNRSTQKPQESDLYKFKASLFPYSVYMVSKFRSGMARLKKGVGITLYINLIFWRYLYVRSVQIGLNLLWMAPWFVLFCFS